MMTSDYQPKSTENKTSTQAKLKKTSLVVKTPELERPTESEKPTESEQPANSEKLLEQPKGDGGDAPKTPPMPAVVRTQLVQQTDAKSIQTVIDKILDDFFDVDTDRQEIRINVVYEAGKPQVRICVIKPNEVLANEIDRELHPQTS